MLQTPDAIFISGDPQSSSDLQSGPPAVARWDQAALDFASSEDGMTVSHAHTTEYSASVIGDGEARRNRRDPSIYSFTSGDAQMFTRDFNGRTFNALNEAYLLPNDGDESERLDKQHIAIVIGLGGLTPCPELVDAVLTPVEGEVKRVLDLGCGSGAWAMEMARLYPKCEVVGIDLSPPPLDPSLFPNNLRFEIDDINRGLEHFHNEFDLVHSRCISGGIERFGEMMQDAERCLKPGGLMVFVDGDGTIYSTDRLHPAKLPRGLGPSEPGDSWFRKVCWEAWTACMIAGSSLEEAQRLQDIGLWDHPLCDPKTAGGGCMWLPIGPWAKVPDQSQSQLLGYSGALIRQAFLSIHRAYHGILLKHGLPQDTLDEWSKRVDDELHTMNTKLWVRFRFCWARRRAAPDEAAPPLPNGLSDSALVPAQSRRSAGGSPVSGSKPRYPCIRYWYTAEDAKSMREEMQNAANKAVIPQSDVRRAWAQMQQ